MADTQPYGDVQYADPGYQDDGKKRYPIDNAEHVKAAWSYINKPANQKPYTAQQVDTIKGRIKAAAKKYGVEISDDQQNSAAPTSDLIRMGSRDVTVAGDGRTLTGYPIVFNTPTEINSWEGRFIERIAPTALDKTLTERGDKVKVLFNHGMDPEIGDKPLGKPTVMRTDSSGLYVEVPLSDTSYNRDLLALIRDGAIDGQSFRFSVPKGKDSWVYPTPNERRAGKLPERTIHELSLAEFGPVTFPAYEATTVGVRSREDFRTWKGLNDAKRARISEIMRADSDEDPTSLAEAVDAVLDELEACLASGDTGQCAALLVAAEATIDALISVLGGVDADDDDSPMMATTGMYSKSVADLQQRTSAAREQLEAARHASGAAASTPKRTSKTERQAVARRIAARRMLNRNEQAA